MKLVLVLCGVRAFESFKHGRSNSGVIHTCSCRLEIQKEAPSALKDRVFAVQVAMLDARLFQRCVHASELLWHRCIRWRDACAGSDNQVSCVVLNHSRKILRTHAVREATESVYFAPKTFHRAEVGVRIPLAKFLVVHLVPEKTAIEAMA